MIRKVKGGYRLFSTSNGRPLGPVRNSPEEAKQKDEARVRFFVNLEHSSGGPGSLKAKVKKKSLLK